jgi:heme/copper-type cytochrome/quinol oxidase subunit 1
MTTIETHADAAGESVVAAFFAGIAAWLTSTDHKRIGRMYLCSGVVGTAAGGVVAALLGAERSSESAFLDAGALVQMFQLERLALVYFGLVPLTLGLAIAVVPLQLGARQIAFPRLALTGFYAWLGGLVLSIVALADNGGVGGGNGQAVDQFLAGHGLMFLGLLASAGSVATSVLTTRAPGMTMRRVPLFAWSSLIGALGMLLALPVAFGAVIYLFIDHRLGTAANFGGAEGVGAWLGWVYSVPAVIVFALPAVGIAAELVPVTFKARQPLRGVIFAGIALVGVASLAAVTTQAVHDVSLDADQSFATFVKDLLPLLALAGLPLLGLVVVMGLGGLTVRAGMTSGARPAITSGFLFAFLGLGMIFVGVAGNLVMAIADLELVGTVFEEGAVIYVVYGAAMAVLGGVAFWAPKLWGRTLPEKAVVPLALLAFVGTILASLPLYVAGFLDQIGGLPANAAQVDAVSSLEYHGSAELWNSLSMIGHIVMLAAVLAFALSMLSTFARRGAAAEANPFGGHTIEWSTSSPAPADNYDYVPTVASPTPVFDLTAEGSRS